METSTPDKNHPSKKRYIPALILILLGFLFLGKNIGWIDSAWFGLILSWPMLLTLGGIIAIFRRHVLGGAIATGIGIYFLFLRLNWITHGWMHTYWPLALVALGLIILLKRRDNSYVKSRTTDAHRLFSRPAAASSEGDTREGYVRSDVSFASVKHVVADPVFRGADIDVSFGGIVLDLRHTALEAKETVIHIDCSFGGVELYVPVHWPVQIETHAFIGGCDDRRNHVQPIDTEHRLIVCGNLSFGGIEIKS